MTTTNYQKTVVQSVQIIQSKNIDRPA